MNEETRSIDVYQVDAFTDEPLAGNPAGVVPNARELSDDQMQSIARELAVSETAFLQPGADGSFDTDEPIRIRYFTPSQEVDLCGHATIASFAFLHECGRLEPGTTTIETNVGELELEVESDGTVWMEQESPSVREVELGYDRLADALGVDRTALEGASADLPLAVASTGLPFLAVPITYLSDVGGAEPDMERVERITEEIDATGIYLFTFDTLGGESSVHGRMFAPGAGVPEDPVTGTASGAVGAYLETYDAFDPFPAECLFEQGHYLDRPGTVRVRLGDTVQVGGTAVSSFEGTLAVPPSGEDEILEAS